MGRRLSVIGLSLVVAGLAATAVLLRFAPPHVAGWAVAPALLVTGIGGGWVISPNATLTLRHAPVSMAGAAGGALQTGQRLGAAVGTAALAAVYYAVLSGPNRRVAVSDAVAVAVVVLALVMGLVELRARPRCPSRVDGVAEAVPDAT